MFHVVLIYNLNYRKHQKQFFDRKAQYRFQGKEDVKMKKTVSNFQSISTVSVSFNGNVI